MPSMDLQAIRDFVRVSLDSDDEELPNALLDVFISEGYDNAISVSDTWDFFAVENTLTTVPGVQAYDISGPDSTRDEAFPYAYRSITDVRGETTSLTPLSHRAVRARFRTTSPSSSRPRGFSEFGHNLYLWPIPDVAYDIQVSGYRAPVEWVAQGAGAEPDAPTEFHEVVAFHALSRGNAQQGDPDMAGYYSQLFADRVRMLKARYGTPKATGPFIQNGGLGGPQSGIGPLFYPWD